MVTITNAETGAELGTLKETELQFLIDTLEEESAEDDDYYIDLATVDYLKERGADANIIGLLTAAIGDGDYVSIRWGQ